MFAHWYVVANQKKIRVFTEVPERNRLKLLKSLINPLGEEKRKSLVKKEAGHGIKSLGRVGVARYTENKRHDPHEEAAQQFASEIADFLEHENQQKNFDSLTIVAEPRFLGKIKAAMKPRLKKLVTDWVKKDLQKTPQKELQAALLT